MLHVYVTPTLQATREHELIRLFGHKIRAL